MRSLILALLALLTFNSNAQQFSPRYTLTKLKEVNSVYHDAAPVISPDGKKLYLFVADHPSNTYGKEGTQDIWLSTKDDKGVWSAPQHLGSPFNQNKSNQVFQVLPDGSLFVRGGRSKNDKGFSLVSPGGSWSEIGYKDFATMAKGRFNGATISANKQHMILYFSETDKGIKSDLYVSHLEGGAWSKPVKLKISSSADEFAPFVGPDDKTLYFASDRLGQGRQGGTDIYKATRLDDSWNNWTDPVNLGKSINTAAADDYFSVDAAGNVYTARSNSRSDGGNLDVFILVPRSVKVMLTGIVLDEKTKQPVPANVSVTVNELKPILMKAPASGKFETKIPETNKVVLNANASGYQPRDLEVLVPPLGSDTTLIVEVYLTPIARALVLGGTVFNKKTNEPIAAKVNFSLKPERKNLYSITAPDGKYQAEVEKLGWYVLQATAEGYLSASDSVNFATEDLSPVVKDLFLQPIEVGLTVRLKNIYFDFDKTTLKSESFVELNKVVSFLEDNKTVEIEISGHTDSKGSDVYNLNLSQGRSQAVVDYLVTQGIDRARLTAKGYGESKPIDSNDTEAGRSNNRRVEFTVLKK